MFYWYQSFWGEKSCHLFLMAEIALWSKSPCVLCVELRSLLEHLGALKSTMGLRVESRLDRQRSRMTLKDNGGLPVRAPANRWSRFGHWALIKSTNWPLHPLPHIPLSLPPSVSSSIHSKSRSSLQSRWPADGGLRHGRPAAHGNQTTW